MISGDNVMCTLRSFLVWLVSFGPISSISHHYLLEWLTRKHLHIRQGLDWFPHGIRFPVLQSRYAGSISGSSRLTSPAIPRWTSCRSGGCGAVGRGSCRSRVICVSSPFPSTDFLESIWERTIHPGWNSAKSRCWAVVAGWWTCAWSINKVAFLLTLLSDRCIVH